MIRKIGLVWSALLTVLLIGVACGAPAEPQAALSADGDNVVPVEAAPAEEIVAAPTRSTKAGSGQLAAPSTPSPPIVVESPEPSAEIVRSQVGDAPVEVDAGPNDEQQWVLDGLPSLGLAPELRNEVWLNSEPLRLADLRGKVVLLDMWTFG